VRDTTAAIVAFCALALSGCVTAQERPPANHAFLDMYDRPSARAHKAKVKVRKAPAPTATTGSVATVSVGSAAPATTLTPYSPEWWAAERAREQRENERLKRVMQICRGC